MERKKLHNSQYRLRKSIGILGILLPILLLINHEYLLASMSHYYYTSSGVFFIGILTAFGLVLFTYEGYPVDNSKKELLSDEAVTNLAAICIFITILVPTGWSDSLGHIYFAQDENYLFGHDISWKEALHLCSAGLFIILLGYMCFAKFTMSPDLSRRKRLLYKTCGIITWFSVGVMIILLLIDKNYLDNNLETHIPAYIFWCETIAVWAFGIAWLVKGEFDKNVYSFAQRINIRRK